MLNAMKQLDYKTKIFGSALVAILILFGIYSAAKGSIFHSKPLTKASSISAGAQDQEITNFNSTAKNMAGQNQVLASAINGVMVDPSKVGRPYAVVVENHPASRPQSGLSQADIVYEALAEGGITRFLGIFQTQKVASIGPVRSARTYFNDWAEEIGAIFTHVGGNSDALADIRARDYPDISDADQFFNDPYFWRIKARKMPHNTYTSTDKLASLVHSRGYSTAPTYQTYIFKDDQPAAKPIAAAINIKFSTASYDVSYKYDKATNSYKRIMAGKNAIDSGNGKQIAPKNIVVQIIRNWPTQTDTILSIDMATHESGNAYVFLDGKEISGNWKYINGRTRFFDSTGNEIALNKGQIFIEMVPPNFESKLTWK
jgi:hypothetical protein